MIRWIFSIPMFFYLLVAANMVMLSGPEQNSLINVILFEFTVPSGRSIVLTISDAFILASVAFLFIEAFKATRTSDLSILDHALSLVVFVLYLIEFLVVPQLGNTTFLIMAAAALVDVISGIAITISTARRDLSVGPGL